MDDLIIIVSEKAVAPHSSSLAWKIPWTEEPGGLQSMGSYVQAYLLAVPITSLGHSLDRLPRWLSGKELPANAGDAGLISG